MNRCPTKYFILVDSFKAYNPKCLYFVIHAKKNIMT